MYREPIVMQGKLGLKSMVWTRRKKEISNQKRMKKQEFKKNKERLRNLQDILKCSHKMAAGGSREAVAGGPSGPTFSGR